MKPRQYTTEEMKAMFLDHLHALVDYWANETRMPDPKAKLDGLAFSILSAIDGDSGGLPRLGLVPDPHPDDQAYHESEGENWWGGTEPINDVPLHEIWYQVKS